MLFSVSYHSFHSIAIYSGIPPRPSIVYPIYRTTSPITARQPARVHQISLFPSLPLSFFSRSKAVMRNLFKSKSPSNRTSHHSMRSAEQLAHPAFTPPDPNAPNTESDRRLSQFEYSGSVQNQPQGLNRSQSQRQKPLRDRPTVNVTVPDDSRKKGRVERSVSVKGKPISQPTSPGTLHPETLDESDEFPPHLRHSYTENPSPVAPQSLAYQPKYQGQRAPRPSHPAHVQDNPEWSQKPVQPVQPLYTKLQRSNTDSTLDQYSRPSPTDIPESPRYTEHLHRGQAFSAQDPVLNTRPPSQQTHEPLSPLQSRYPDAMQSSAQASNQGFYPLDRQKSAGSPQQNRSRQGSVSNNMPDPGRSTPTKTHRREESGEVDVRALIQKHDELRKDYDSVLVFDKLTMSRGQVFQGETILL